MSKRLLVLLSTPPLGCRDRKRFPRAGSIVFVANWETLKNCAWLLRFHALARIGFKMRASVRFGGDFAVFVCCVIGLSA